MEEQGLEAPPSSDQGLKEYEKGPILLVCMCIFVMGGAVDTIRKFQPVCNTVENTHTQIQSK